MDVFHFNEGNASCYRIPSLVALADGRLLAFAAARHYVGDGCVPTVQHHNKSGKTFQVMKMSSSGGR